MTRGNTVATLSKIEKLQKPKYFALKGKYLGNLKALPRQAKTLSTRLTRGQLLKDLRTKFRIVQFPLLPTVAEKIKPLPSYCGQNEN